MRTALRTLSSAALRLSLPLAVALSLSLGSVGAARAQQAPSASETALAREQFREGMGHAQASRWQDAYAAFSRAYSLVRRPLVLLNLAGAEEQTGRLVQAAEHYRQFLREVTSGREAQQRPVAEQGLARVEPRIPRARFMLAQARSTDSYVLDDQPISAAVMGTALPLDPGAHTLVVRSDGSEIGRIAFTLAEREAKDVLVSVTRPTQPVALVPRADAATANTRVAILPRNGEDPLPAPRERDDEGGGVLASPVFWIIVGVVVIGGATAGVLVATSGGSDPYSGNLGSIPIR